MLWLSVAPLVSGLVAEMFGPRYMATLLGIAFVMHQVGSSLGAWGGGLIFDATGSYDWAWQTIRARKSRKVVLSAVLPGSTSP
jgi:hypothetical protein